MENCLIFQDEGSLAEELPGLQSLMAAVNRNVLHTVVCSDIGVICKNTAELVETVRQLESKDTALILVKNAVDFSTAMRRSVLLACNTFLELGAPAPPPTSGTTCGCWPAAAAGWAGYPTGYTSVRKPENSRVKKLLPPTAARTGRNRQAHLLFIWNGIPG